MTSSAMRGRPADRKIGSIPLPIFMIAAGFVVACFLLGGASRADVLSIAILRPLAVFALALGCWSLKLHHLSAYKSAAILLTLTIALIAAHLVPLPPTVWQTLPGRDLIAAIDRQAGLGDIWRPLSLSPLQTRNALLSMTIPVAIFVLGIQLPGRDLRKLVLVILAMITLSALIGILQILGSPNGPLYFYRITNNGSAVGLFSNRNHQAVLLATSFPLLAVLMRARAAHAAGRWRAWIAAGLAALLLPLILVTGSRTGVVVAVVTGVLSVVLYLSGGDERPTAGALFTRRRLQIGAGVAIVALVSLTIALSRAEAVRRLFATDSAEDPRLQAWPLVAEMAVDYLPWGSGIGSFVETFRIGEPDRFLQPTYLNHAHNDFLEVVLTAGVPGALLMLAGLLLLGWDSIRAWRADGNSSNVLLARAGSVVMLGLVISSIPDYPLRTPSLACFFVIAWLWTHALSRSDLSTDRRPDSTRITGDKTQRIA